MSYGFTATIRIPQRRACFEMYKVREAVRSGKREVVIVENQGKFVGGASLSFVQWMQKRVPDHQLSAEQMALVKWYEDNRLHDEGGAPKTPD